MIFIYKVQDLFSYSMKIESEKKFDLQLVFFVWLYFSSP